jgi:two-component system phosphate regulon sensor histidine kinase PhoR
LNELLNQAFQVMQPSAEQKQIKLISDLSPMFLGILADRDMLMQCAINLLSNAVKYTNSGGTVTLRSKMEDAFVLFEVEDTGVGMSEEDCQRVFEKFYRVKKDQEMAPGTGLGLPLAKHIAEDVHGGSLSATSQLGKGSVFRVSLPKHR